MTMGPASGNFRQRMRPTSYCAPIQLPKAPPPKKKIQRTHIRMQRIADWWLPAMISGSTVAVAQGACAAHLRDLIIEFHARENEYLTHMLGLLTASTNLRSLCFHWHPYGSRPTSSAGYELGRHLSGLPGFAPPLVHLSLAPLCLREEDVLRLL